MKNLKKNCVKLLLVFVYVLTVFAPYFTYAQDTPKKGDLKFDGTTAYIGANDSGADTGLIVKEDQYTSVNNESVEVATGLFKDAEGNDVTKIDHLSENDVEVRKIVTKLNDTGKYKVDFQVRGKGTKLQVRAPVYAVVVFDNSNSMAPIQETKGTCTNWMTEKQLQEDIDDGTGRCFDKWYNAIDGAKEFGRIIMENIPSTNLALVSFAGKKGNLANGDATVVRGFSNNNFSTLNNTDSSLKIEKPIVEQPVGEGGTNLEAGLKAARDLLDSAPSNALKYVLVMGDGEPTFYYSYDKNLKDYYTAGSGSKFEDQGRTNAINEANDIKTKNHAKIYSIGYEVESAPKAKEVLNAISSNVLQDGVYVGDYYASGNISTIANRFTDIAQEIVRDAGINAYIVDNIGSAFTGIGTGVDNDAGTYTSPIIPSIYETWTNLGSFEIQIDVDSPTGWYNTNDGFELNYYDVVNSVDRKITCEDNPEVYWVQNTYNYEVRFYYENDNGEYIEDLDLRKENLQAAHNATVSELESVIMDNTHLKNNYKFVEVRDEDGELINKNEDKYSIVIDKNTRNIIRVYYEKVYTLSITKLVNDYDPNNEDMTRFFQFQVKLKDLNNNPVSGVYHYKLNNGSEINEIQFNNQGIANINLKHNQTIKFIDLPKFINYKVTEINTDGFVVEITKPDNQVEVNYTTEYYQLNSNQSVQFLNITEYILPETGSSAGLILSIVVVLLLGTPVVNILYPFAKKVCKLVLNNKCL